ncbi:DUF4232 domain-containing protein [Streptomyces sp. NBC_00631]|uniref:DUF4232 domain-containing protein n=1 Tax=Streptomyces sp. NBC_00631 TaxID=2975793 RepID=UPI0030DEB5F8
MRLRHLTAALTATVALGLGTAAFSGTASAGTGGDPAGSTASPAAACDTSALHIAFDGKAAYSAPGEQIPVTVLMTNTSDATCSLQGFPSVDLKAGSDTWPLLHSSGAANLVSLAPGTSARFVITYISWEQGSGAEFQATSAVITPPGATTSVTLPWPGSSILRQDSATHPGTYVGPVTA